MLLLLAACADLRKEAVAKIDAAEAKELRIETAKIYKDLRGRYATEYIPLKPAAWPARFKKYKPKRVGLYPDGIALVLDGDATSEQGLHITPLTMDLAPTRGRIRYEKVQDGVYWYQLGK